MACRSNSIMGSMTLRIPMIASSGPLQPAQVSREFQGALPAVGAIAFVAASFGRFWRPHSTPTITISTRSPTSIWFRKLRSLRRSRRRLDSKRILSAQRLDGGDVLRCADRRNWLPGRNARPISVLAAHVDVVYWMYIRLLTVPPVPPQIGLSSKMNQRVAPFVHCNPS